MTTRYKPWLASSFLVQFIAPLAVGILLMLTALLLPSSYAFNQGTSIPIRLLNTHSAISPQQALINLQNQASHLQQKTIPDIQTWLLADLSDRSKGQSDDLLISATNTGQPKCWLIGGLGMAGEKVVDPDNIGVAKNALQVINGWQVEIPPGSAANRLLCQFNMLSTEMVHVEQWGHNDLDKFLANNARNNATLEGGLLLLAFFLTLIGILLREQPYLLVAGWLIGNLRLAAWVFGWDSLWLGHNIDPAMLFWVRKLTLILYFWLTWQVFIRLYSSQYKTETVIKLHQAGKYGSLILAVAILLLDRQSYVIFAAVWITAVFIAIILTQSLFHYKTRAQFIHTLSVCLACIFVLAGLALVGLQQQDLINQQLGVLVVLFTSVIVALAASNRMREERTLNFKNLNELIARDALTPMGMFTLGATRHFERLNQNTRDILQIEGTIEPHQIAWDDYFPKTDWVSVSNETEHGGDTEITTIEDKAGNSKSFLLRAIIVGNRIEGSLQDISARTESIRKLRLMANNDPLTDTLNRKGIEQALQDSIDNLKNSDTPYSLGFLDVDHLRKINHLFGHATGDTLLQTISERLKYLLNEQQQLGRIGSDEFIILFPGMTAKQASQVGKDIIESLNESALYVGNRAFQLKTSLGIIDLDRKMSSKDAITAANRACREARKQHKDIVIYETNDQKLYEHIGELHILEQIEDGKEPEDIYLSMQPIMSLRYPLSSMNFEVLLRIRGNPDNPTDTSKIIAAAEDNGMITNIDKWVFSTTLDWMAKHRIKLSQTQMVNINLSGVSLNDDKFIDQFFNILGKQPQYSRRLCVEITEGVALQDLERTRQFMRRLQRMGTKVALDDFGAGYTSFSYLKELPADLIKIDGSLICDMLNSETNIAIVNSIIDLAHNLGMECIAEWVEDIATLKALTDMGVDHVQGYVVSPAKLPHDILAHNNVLHLVKDPEAVRFIEQLSGKRPQ